MSAYVGSLKDLKSRECLPLPHFSRHSLIWRIPGGGFRENGSALKVMHACLAITLEKSTQHLVAMKQARGEQAKVVLLWGELARVVLL